MKNKKQIYRGATKKQLKRLHGTPKQFEDAVWLVVGDVSVSEAREAIALYRKEWRMAK